MAKRPKKNHSTLQKIEIRAVPSQYRPEGFFSQVEARITWCFNGTQISILEERSGAAVGHRLVADALEATPPSEQWAFSTEVATSYRDITQVKIAIELADGGEGEMERAKALLTEITARLK